MPRGTDNATCHTRDLTRGIFLISFSKKLKNKNKNKKVKKIYKKIKKNHRLTRGTSLTALVNSV